MTRRRGELPEPEEALLGIERPTIEQEEAAKREHDEAIKFERDYFVHLMQQPIFRAWVMRWINAFGAFDNAFGSSPVGFPDPLATHFKLGMKAAGWDLWEFFDELSPEQASLMRREARQSKG